MHCKASICGSAPQEPTTQGGSHVCVVNKCLRYGAGESNQRSFVGNMLALRGTLEPRILRFLRLQDGCCVTEEQAWQSNTTDQPHRQYRAAWQINHTGSTEQHGISTTQAIQSSMADQPHRQYRAARQINHTGSTEQHGRSTTQAIQSSTADQPHR